MAELTVGLQNTCKSCKHFGLRPEDMRVGVCKRYPPTFAFVITPTGPQTIPAQPNIDANYPACGEFAVKLSLQQ